MKFWWLSDTLRFAAEKAGVETLVGEGWFTLERWYVDELRLAALGTISVGEHRYEIRLIFGDQFPLVPVWVEPQDRKAKWSNHQYGSGGTLCLELRPDTWTSSATAVDVLRSAYDLLRKENPLGDSHDDVQSAHRIGTIQSYAWSRQSVLVGGECFLRLINGEAEEPRALRWRSDERLQPIYVTDAEQRSGSDPPPTADDESGRTELKVIVGTLLDPDAEFDDSAALLAAVGATIDSVPEGTPFLVLAKGSEGFRPYHCLEDGTVQRRKLVVVDLAPGLRSGREMEQKPRRVAIVGVGSVGSKIAEMLVRSGVRRLLIVDGDIFLPGNIERHTLDWRDVGFEKVYGVKRQLEQVAPSVEVTVIADNLDWQRSALTHSQQLDDIASCDLVVDSSGDAATSLLLGAIASENSLPFLSAVVYEGGIGALVARAVPGRDPSYADGRQAYSAYCEQQGVPASKSGARRYEAIFDSGTPVIADDAAVTIAAASAARTALDILDDPNGLPKAAWLLMGFRKSWLFERHGHNIMLDVGDARAPTMSEADVDPEARDVALALAREALDAAKTSA